MCRKAMGNGASGGLVCAGIRCLSDAPSRALWNKSVSFPEHLISSTPFLSPCFCAHLHSEIADDSRIPCTSRLAKMAMGRGEIEA